MSVDAEIRQRIDSFRGYSAYEIAVQNGYSGTEQEWLASLARTATVNGISAVNGNIAVTGANVARSGSDATTVDAALSAVEGSISDVEDELAGIVSITAEEIDAVLAG